MDAIENQPKDEQPQSEKWLEPSKRIFDYCAYAGYHLANGDNSTKRNVLCGLGSKLTLMHGKLNVQAYEPYLLIKEALITARAENRRLETTKSGSTKEKEAAFATSSPSWLPTIEAIRNWIAENWESFSVPKLTPPDQKQPSPQSFN